jgi:pyridoxamine 5'-phosphate oxidase
MSAPMLSAADPWAAFSEWFQEAQAREIDVPDAMTVATVGPDGRPSIRNVLLKGHDDRGLVFFTHLGSRKATDLSGSPFVAVCFHWKSLERQVIAEGAVSPLSRAEVEAYFATRPRGSRIGAWASLQSRPLANFSELEGRVQGFAAQFADQEVPTPPDWGGFRIEPRRFEFWQGRPDRLHVRTEFVRDGAVWRKGLLFP